MEPFNGKLRDELLNGEVFNSLQEAQVLIERWRQRYNEERPYSALATGHQCRRCCRQSRIPGPADQAQEGPRKPPSGYPLKFRPQHSVGTGQAKGLASFVIFLIHI